VGISHGYAPLEQYQQGGVSTFSPATDIYSLGATLYKLITGNTPPNATVVNEDGLPEIPSSVSPSVSSAIERSMHPVRKNRLQSVADFLALLDAPAPDISRQEKTEMEHNQNEETELGDIDAVKHEDKGDDGEFVSMFAAEEKRSPIAKLIIWVCVILFLIVGIAAALFVNGEEYVPVVEEYVPPTEAIVVDLGLPSGTLWADRNVGAFSPEDYGSYFAWGETESKSTYDWCTYNWSNGSDYQLTKYCTKISYGHNGFTDKKTTLDSFDDAATTNMGDNWHMPTEDEFKELIDKCVWTWTTRNGVNGYKATGPNGNSIFFPVTGYYFNSDLTDVGIRGFYWSSSFSEYYPNRALCLDIDSDNCDLHSHYRAFGCVVRGVLAE
jgi:serine/threonine protein kinase